MIDTRKPAGVERAYVDAVIRQVAKSEKASQINQTILMGVFDIACITFIVRFVAQVMPTLDVNNLGNIAGVGFIALLFGAIILGLTISCIKTIVYKPWNQILANASSEGYEIADVMVVRTTKPGHSVTNYRVLDQQGEVLMKTIKDKKIENHVRGLADLDKEGLYVKLNGVEPGFLNQFVIPRYNSGHKYSEQIINNIKR